MEEAGWHGSGTCISTVTISQIPESQSWAFYFLLKRSPAETKHLGLLSVGPGLLPPWQSALSPLECPCLSLPGGSCHLSPCRIIAGQPRMCSVGRPASSSHPIEDIRLSDPIEPLPLKCWCQCISAFWNTECCPLPGLKRLPLGLICPPLPQSGTGQRSWSGCQTSQTAWHSANT